MRSTLKNYFSDFSRNYYLILIFLAASLPLSVFTTSVAEIALLLNWLLEGKFTEKIDRLRKRKAVIIVSLIFGLHILGLLYTSDFQYGFHDLKIKLPILLLPLLIGSSASLSEKQLRNLLLLFSAAVLASSLISASIFFGIFDYKYYDFRDISILISHIRLSLMVDLTICCLVYFGFGGDAEPLKNKKFRIVILLVAIWLILFLLILKSVTGIIIFLVLLLFLGWKYSSRIDLIAPRFIVRVLIITIPLVIATWLSHAVSRYYFREKIDFSKLQAFTPDGNPYYNNPETKWVENGNYVWINVCEPELRQEWNKLSSLDYDGKDKMGQYLRFTLIRYMTSKGLSKDAGGIRQMDKLDIQAVENGVANYIFLNKYSLYPRVYQIIWELDSYRNGNNPSGHSITQRLAYIKAAGFILKNNLIIGVGTGDVQHEFNNYYSKSDNPLMEKSRRRAHNQYYTFLITFGIVGFLFIVFALFYPVFLEKQWGDYLFVCFGIIGFLSMLNEDTLETQTGVSFFMFFYSLFLFGRNQIKSPKSIDELDK
jgi:hypothetical protein